MNNRELERLLIGYPVTVCASDQIQVRKGHFVISNTDNSKGPGKHWVTFYFPRHGALEFFDSLGHSPDHYKAGFEKLLTTNYWMNSDRIQDYGSDSCGFYCVYYVISRRAGLTFKDIVKHFNVHDKTRNDQYVIHYVNNNK